MSAGHTFESEAPARSLWDLQPSPLWTMLFLAAMVGGHAAKEAAMSALIGLAAVLVAISVVSAPELFELAPRRWTLWLLPGFALAQNAGRSWLKARNR